MAKASKAKVPDLLSDSYAADDDAWLDKLIADEEESDRAMLWRLGSWGIAAVAALTVGLASGQLPGAAQRSDAAATELARQTQRLDGLARETGQETRRLSAAIDTLNQDRDRLFSRMTSVEQGLDTVTGSIARPASAIAPDTVANKPDDKPPPVAPKETAATPPPVLAVAPVVEVPRDPGKAAPKEAAKPSDPPPVAQPKPSAETAIKKADRSDAARPLTATAATVEAASEAAANPASANAATVGPLASNGAAAADSAATLAVAKPGATPALTAPTPPSAIVSSPLPALPIDANQFDAATQAEAPVERTQFGLDLGGASSMTGLRSLWNGVRKSHGAQLGEFRPLLAIKPSKNGLGLQVHVVAGPIADAAAAAKLCAQLIADQRDCEATVFDGQRLVLDPADAKTKAPATAHRARHRQTRRDEPLETRPPPKPSMLTWLGVR